MHPIATQSMVTDRSLLKYPEVFGSLDRGCSLTKALYVKSVPDQPTRASLEMAVFANTDFTQALDWLVAKAIEEGAFGVAVRRFHVTGVGGEKFRGAIEERLRMDVSFVDEFMCQQTGARFLLSNFEDDQFCYPEEVPPASKVTPEMPERVATLLKRIDQAFAANDGCRLPVIFGFCGSATGFSKLNEDGSTDILGISWFGGKSFLGLSQLLLGTNNYDEIMELVSRGDRRRVDTLAKEMIAQDEKSEYRMLPADCPLFPFGKASEGKVGSFSREDLAAAVVGSVTVTLVPQISSYCKANGVRRAYLGGHFFRAKEARDILLEYLSLSPISRRLQVRFLSNGHTGCIGALQVTTEDAQTWHEKLNTQPQPAR